MNFSEIEGQALERLIAYAQPGTGGGKRVAAFLLAWWNADRCGGYNLVDAWYCDDDVVEDIIVIFNYIVRNPRLYPDQLGYGDDFEKLVLKWR